MRWRNKSCNVSSNILSTHHHPPPINTTTEQQQQLQTTKEDNCKQETRQFPKPRQVTLQKIEAKARIDRYDGCLRYKCANYTQPHCQDNFAETDYSSNNPPCCTHILRDVIRSVDEALCGLGLEHFAGYGTPLGLMRDDHVIPWTADNDFVVSFAVAAEMHKERSHLEEKFGLHLFNDFYLRACVTETFMDGALLPWKTDEFDQSINKTGKFVDHFPYADFFYGEVDPQQGQFIDERGCGYDEHLRRPAKRRSVYNQTFHVSVPNDYNLVLDKAFGPNWKIPDSGKGHGYA